jgi:peptidoglycan/LPS O-acetylase OafA/YrhL
MLLTLTKAIDNFKIGWIGMAGALTYPLYLIHGRIGGTMIQHFANDRNKWFVYIAILVLLIGVAYGMLKLEKKVLNWKIFKAIAGKR